MRLHTKIFSLLFASMIVLGCSENDLLPTTVSTKDVSEIKSIRDARSIMRGALNGMTASSYYGRDYIIYGETYADNTFANGNSGRFTNIYYAGLQDNDGSVTSTWSQIYSVISNTNLLLNKEIEVADDYKEEYKHIKGEAYMIRAMAHFDLLRYYGQQNVGSGGMSALGVPYQTVYRPEGEELSLKRNTVGEVVQMINQDLDKALEYMDSANDSNSDYAVTSNAAKALKVRVALYFKDYDMVVKVADEIINSGNYSVLGGEDYVKSWNNTSSTLHTNNWLFALANTTTDQLGINGLSHIYQNTSYGDVVARDVVTTLFESGDVRGLSKMIVEDDGYRNYGKYPRHSPSDYSIPLFRYEEVLMSKAEALFYKGNTAEALAIFNDINAKRGASELTSLDKNTIIDQWRKEFYFEGFRFHTLARNGEAFSVPSVKDVPYGNYQYAFPIPREEINNNSNAVQNEGY